MVVVKAPPSPPPFADPQPREPVLDSLAEIRDRALRATDVAFVITDATAPGAPITWVNEAYTRTTGYTLDEVVGRNPALLQGPATDRAEAARLAAAIVAGRSATVTLLNYRKDGSPFWNQVSVSPVPDADGVVTHWAGIQVDVTQQVLHDDAQQQSIVAERRARTGLALVSQVSDLLSDLEDPYVLREIAALLRHEVVGWAGFFVEDGGLRAVHGIDVGFREPPVPRRHGPREPGREPSGPADPVQDLLDGTLDGPIEVLLDAPAMGPTTRRLADQLHAQLRHQPEPVEVVVVHAVAGRRRTQGVLVTVPRRGRGLAGFDEADRTVLYLVVRRVGMAVDNVRLYAREHRLAETLQRSMLPEQADVTGLDVWTYYAPSSGHAQVGGDWYDVLQVEPEGVVLVIGDVVGHDVEAAASMGQLRSVVRSFAYDGADPGDVLNRVDQLVAGMRIPRAASLVLVTMLPTATGWSLRYSRAGHLPPLVAHDGVVTQLSDAAGTMIGFGAGGRVSGRHDLYPGDVLVLYTDGLIERRDRTLRAGLDELVAATGRVGTVEAAGVGEELLSRLADAPQDDIAVVVVRVPDPDHDPTTTSPSPRRRRWSMPSEPGSIARARQAVLRTCAAWDLPGAASAELVVSELVANAVLHGWGHVVLRLFDTGEGLRIEVEDANPAPPVTTDGHPGRVGGYGMRIVERLADWGWRPSGTGKLVWARVRPVAPGEPPTTR
ncbi:MAG TPA: SpoIIE family protein phosphatase [Actinotalea sp.]|nr:SpoIIE family protein phosphatase [Actinotalea sp.]